MKIVHVIAGILPRYGGPSVSVPAICENLHQQEVNITLATVGHEKETLQRVQSFGFNCFAAQKNLFPVLCSSRELFQYLCQVAADIVHCQTIWNLPSYYGAVAARKRNIPYLMTPRGMLEPWGLSHSKWKKKFVGWLFQSKALREASCLHATAVQEYESIRKYGLKNPVAIIPNGVDVDEFGGNTNTEGLFEQYPELRRKKLIVFLSRIHPKKGLVNLAKVWGDLFRDFSDWHLVIAGPDESEYLVEVKKAISEFEVARQTTFTGPVYGDLKRQLYAACDFFVLPTFSENFGIVIAEALASGKPVVTTKATPWEELQTHDCGWYLDIGIEPLRVALKEAMEVSDSRRQEMGARGRKLIEENYSWPKLASQMIDVYKWVLGQSDKPDCVRLD